MKFLLGWLGLKLILQVNGQMTRWSRIPTANEGMFNPIRSPLVVESNVHCALATVTGFIPIGHPSNKTRMENGNAFHLDYTTKECTIGVVTPFDIGYYEMIVKAELERGKATSACQ